MGLAALALLVVGLAGCSGGEADVASSGAAVAGSGEGVEDGAGGPKPAQGVVETKAGDVQMDAAAARVVQVRSVIRTGEVALADKDLDGARTAVLDLVTALGGRVDSEQTTNDRSGDVRRSTLVLKVPVAKFGAAMTALEGIGTSSSSSQGEQDVTRQVIDVDERAQTLQNSLDRLQDYQRDAADVDELIRFEEQITQRTSELQSLQAQRAYLADQTSLSTITVRLTLPEEYVEPPGALDEAGFLTGLQNGWGALTDTVVVALTVLGAVLPFLVVLAVVGVPVVVILRRTWRRRPPVPTPAE